MMSDEEKVEPSGSETEPALAGAGAAAEAEAPDLEAMRVRIAALQQRMEELRAATEEEVLKAWQSPWRGPDAVKAKIDSRLASNAEYRTVMAEARDAQMLVDRLDPEHAAASTARAAGGHPAIGR